MLSHLFDSEFIFLLLRKESSITLNKPAFHTFYIISVGLANAARSMLNFLGFQQLFSLLRAKISPT